MQPKFIKPDFLEHNSTDEIHERMMGHLPDDIDDMPGGFPYDFTRPAAMEKDELINFHLVRALMLAFPQYAWDEWLDLHGKQVHLERHTPAHASGYVEVTGIPGTEIASGTVFCTPATDTGPSIEFRSVEDMRIGEDGCVLVLVEAAVGGASSNVPANAVVLMAKPDKDIIGVRNPDPIRGGTERESNDDYYDRIAAEYGGSRTFLGNDSDYIRWAKEAGAGDCIVIPVPEGPGTVALALVDGNGQPANEKLVEDVYRYIVSPDDRSRRILPTACSKLICRSASTVRIDFFITGLLYDGTTEIRQIEEDFCAALKPVYELAKEQGILRYNDVRPILSDIAGVIDFHEFFMNGDVKNIHLGTEEYPETGTLNFSQGEAL